MIKPGLYFRDTNTFYILLGINDRGSLYGLYQDDDEWCEVADLNPAPSAWGDPSAELEKLFVHDNKLYGIFPLDKFEVGDIFWSETKHEIIEFVGYKNWTPDIKLFRSGDRIDTWRIKHKLIQISDIPNNCIKKIEEALKK